ncbi:MAG: alpha/beta hydrolase [Magnetovibrio sp.]|nr:alpha/beta hydrolase [Magnetovibrio sp.]
MDVTVDGKRAHAATGSRENAPGDPAVVLVHGAGLDRTIWQMQTRNIAFTGRRCYAVDLPGHGRSDGPALASVAEMADWVIRFMDAAGIDKATLMGHSMGSLITLDAAARHPDRAERLILTGVAETMPVHPDLLAAAEADEPLAPELIVFWGLGEKAQIGGHPLPGLWVHGASEVLLKNAKSGVLGNDLKACDGFGNAAEAAAQVKCPTDFVLGRDDKMTPVKSGVALAGAIDGANVTILERCGHMLMIERPNEMYNALRGIIF